MCSVSGSFIREICGETITLLARTGEILQRFSLMMKSLPRLGEIPVTEKFISQIRPALAESLNVKESEEFIKAINVRFLI